MNYHRSAGSGIKLSMMWEGKEGREPVIRMERGMLMPRA